MLVLHPTRDAALLAADGGLPAAEVPGQLWQGGTREVFEAARAALDADVALLRVIDEPVPPGAPRSELLATCVLRGRPPAGTRWGSVPAELEPLLAEATGRRAVRQPWAHRDWLPAAESWLRAAVAAAGRSLTAPVEQCRVWDLSCVLRAPADGGDVYLKATVAAPLFVDEVRLTVELARLFPGRVPEPVAADRERGLLALADVGPEIGWRAPVEVWEEVVRAFARLQLASLPHVPELLAAGCRDRSLGWLAGQLPVWFEAGTVGRFAPAAVAARLEAAVPRLVALCAELAAHGLPTTLVHGDMHLANVARGPRGLVFFDWTDAAVGHPFLDLIAVDQLGEESERLRDAYLSEWAAVAPPDRLRSLWPLVEVLSPANQAISYMSLGLFLGGGEPSSLFGTYTAQWLEKVLAGLDRLGAQRRPGGGMGA